MDAVRIYANAQNRLFDLAAELTGEQADTPVPALPEWTVAETYAHLSGICADVLGGTLTPPATDTVTARQVAERAHLELGEICQEWKDATPAFLDLLSTQQRTRYRLPVVDIWHHENDLRGALGLAPQAEDVEQLADFTIGGLAKQWSSELPSVRVAATDRDRTWDLGEGGDLHWSGPVLELARAVLGRRSRAQMVAMEWDGDPARVLEYLAVMPISERDLQV
ncbi:maleylpyruvate isomerase N-terminal domain-containing protein [Nocardiopsis xinjiangensis]|uniref:maleylpyruvate isomerase N-terminal domain-containing protein n=1 Tax=Nocardiopsis xinjiangensis TaxID=124285 RepID=UPI000347A1FD|nr:maleylpyruvate isomerase N-terminal domain-containing protein [Nocardiopsis xinjiangensis]